MEKSIKGTRTEQNLLKSFAGESQARSRYTFFASVAKKEGYEQIAGVFMETAEQEKEHAKRFFKFLEGGMVEITASYPAGVIGTTAENLAAAAAGENEEWAELYPEFDKKESGEFDLHKEGGHSEFRILHHADNTGAEIQTSLIETVNNHPNIPASDEPSV